MKKFSFLLLLVILISSCEKDDFCTDPKTTPKLVLRFYDNDDRTETKNVQRLSVIAQGITDSLFTNQTTDSIALPLNTLTNETVYTLKMNNTEDGNQVDNKIATLTIKYETEEEFVTRSCGFRVIYNEVTLSNSGEWIEELSTTSISTINNEISAHVQVYH